MNEDILKGKWKQLEGEIQKEWGKLTKNDLEQINGEAKMLAGKIQEKYGQTSEEAKKGVDSFMKKLKDFDKELTEKLNKIGKDEETEV